MLNHDRSVVTSNITSMTNGSMTATYSDIDRKIKNTIEGLPSECFNYLAKRVLPISRENVLIICDYISSLKSEINPSRNYKRGTIIILCRLSIFFKNDKMFKEITREDLLSFLDSFRKNESVDPMHKWIGTYNLHRIQLMRFFKWLYFPNIDYKQRPKPRVIENIYQLRRKEKSIYKPSDLWIQEDDSLFFEILSKSKR